MSFSRFFAAFAEARDHASEPVRLCVVGVGGGLARVAGVLSAGAADERGGVSSALDVLSPADFPRTSGLAGRWDIVVLVAAGCPAAQAAPVAYAVHSAGGQLYRPRRGSGRRCVGPRRRRVRRRGRARRGRRPQRRRPRSRRRSSTRPATGAAGLAAGLPAVRRAYCDHVILTNATQNAVIGAVVIIPGADMPAMTANQIRMILKIAAAYGEDVGLDRALEILSVVGTAFVFRTLARQALDFVPGFGWALKGTVGFTATVALGEAAIAYFEAGAPLRVSRMQRINRQLDRVRSRLPGVLTRGLSPE